MALLGTTFSDRIEWGSNIIYCGINPTNYGDFCQKEETVSTRSAFLTEEPTFIDRPALYLVKFSMHATGLPKVMEDVKSLILWPNPSSSILNVSLNITSVDFDVKIFSIDGKKNYSASVDFKRQSHRCFKIPTQTILFTCSDKKQETIHPKISRIVSLLPTPYQQNPN